MSNEIKKKGIYMIENIINHKKYIGSTRDSFKSRWKTHKQKLILNKHQSGHLQSAVNKYGINNFKFYIIEIIEDLEILLQREAFYIHFYNTLDNKWGYNLQPIDSLGIRQVSLDTRKKLSERIKELHKNGVYKNIKKTGPAWNKGLKCDNISQTRRQIFNSIAVYTKNNELICTFRSMIDLKEWTKDHKLPGLEWFPNHKNRKIKEGPTQLLNVNRAIRQNKIYRGLIFKKVQPLPPEMGVVKWENCWDGEIPNQQPSQELTILEGSETNS